MKQLSTDGVVLRRTSYQEADRILTVLTSEHGKISLIAKGVRKSKSKLAGGIELFAVNQLSYISGRSSLNTLTSSRSKQNFKHIVGDLDRTMRAYEYLKIIDKLVEEGVPESSDYFEILVSSLEGLNEQALRPELSDVWFYLHVLEKFGVVPDLRTDTDGSPLDEAKTYNFSAEDMQFVQAKNDNQGSVTSDHIKLLRVVLRYSRAKKLSNITIENTIVTTCYNMSRNMVEHHLM
jgi:DNA repair protein RecO (recombination protein O)